MFLHLTIHKPHDLVSASKGLILQLLKHDSCDYGPSPARAGTSAQTGGPGAAGVADDFEHLKMEWAFCFPVWSP